MRLALLLLALTLPGCAHGPQPLAWAKLEAPALSPPTEERAAFFQERIRFEIADKRDEGNVAFRDGARALTTGDDLAAFYGGHFVQALAKQGVQAVEQGESLVVRLSVRRALGTRGDGSWGIKNYVGDFLVLLESRRPQDAAFANAGEVSGSSLRFGSGHADSFDEAMTAAVLDAAQRLLLDRDLLRLLMTPEPPAPAPEPASPARSPVAPQKAE